jgi:hypothetical protein
VLLSVMSTAGGINVGPGAFALAYIAGSVAETTGGTDRADVKPEAVGPLDSVTEG